jgi:hypothetical protein
MNAAIEQHVRMCDQCRAEGLLHLATEKRVAARGGYSERSNRPLRVIALIATLVLLALLLYQLLSHGGRPPLGVHATVLVAALPTTP